MEKILTSLHAMPEVIDAAQAKQDRIGVSGELPASHLLEWLRACDSLQGVIDLELVYVNYEDDMDETGRIDCGSLVEIEAQLKRKS